MSLELALKALQNAQRAHKERRYEDYKAQLKIAGQKVKEEQLKLEDDSATLLEVIGEKITELFDGSLGNPIQLAAIIKDIKEIMVERSAADNGDVVSKPVTDAVAPVLSSSSEPRSVAPRLPNGYNSVLSRSAPPVSARFAEQWNETLSFDEITFGY